MHGQAGRMGEEPPLEGPPVWEIGSHKKDMRMKGLELAVPQPLCKQWPF